MRLSWAIPLLSLSASASSSDVDSLLQIHSSDECRSGKCQPRTDPEPPTPEPTVKPEKPPKTTDPQVIYDPKPPKTTDPQVIFDPKPPKTTDPQVIYDPKPPKTTDPQVIYDPKPPKTTVKPVKPVKPETTAAPFVKTTEPVVTIGTVPETTRKPTPVKTTVAPTTSLEKGLCTLSGDPHIKTFDRVKKDRHFYSYGDYWLVKRQDIWIQARYWSTRPDGNSAVRILAISEPRVNGKVGPVLIVNADPSSTGPNADRNWGGKQYSVSVDGSRSSFEFTFAPDSEVSVNRQYGLLNVMIEMPRPVSGQSGHCGNFNGNAADDVLDKEMVDDKDLLLAPHPTSWGVPSGTQCNAAVQQKAMHACTAMYAAAKNNDPVDIAACVVDYCSAGPDVATMGLVDDLCVKQGKKGQDCDTKVPPAVQAVIVDHDQLDGKKGKKGGADHDQHDGKKGKKGGVDTVPKPTTTSTKARPLPIVDHDQHDGKKGKKGGADNDQHDGKKGKKGGADNDQHDGKKGKQAGADNDQHDGKKGKKGKL